MNKAIVILSNEPQRLINIEKGISSLRCTLPDRTATNLEILSATPS